MLRLWSLVLLFLPTLGVAASPLEQLRDKYREIDAGRVELPSITTPIAPLTADPSLAFVRIPDGEELILNLTYQKHSLGDIFAIKTSDGAQISLTDFTRALDFPIDVNIAQANAQGWARSPEFKFSLSTQEDDQSWSIVSGNEKMTATREDITLDGDIYVDTQLLENWFDLALIVNYQDLSVSVVPNTPIPLAGKLARQGRFDSLQVFSNEPKYPLQEYGYSPISRPVLDIQFRASTAENSPDSHSMSVLGANDLAYFNTQYYFTTDAENDLGDARLSASRYSLEGELLGPLSATEVQFGDIRATRISPLNADPISRGARISNSPLTYQGGNSIDLTGDIQPGWDVEIYRNKLLVASQINVQDGNYFFPSLPLVFGNNEIEVVFYGPQGQIERDFRSYYVSTTSSEQGELRYDVSVVDEGSRLLDKYIENTDEKRDRLLSAKLSYGLTDWFNLYGGIKQYNNSEFSNLDETSFGSELALFGKALLSIDLLDQENDQHRRQYQLDTLLSGQSVSLINRESRVYDSENMVWNDFKSQEAWITGALSNIGLSYQQSVEYLQNNDQNYYRLTNQLGTQLGRSYLSNRLEWLSNNDNLTTGDIQLQRYLNGYFWRIGNRYTAHPDTEIDSLYTELSGDLSEDTSGRIGYTRDFNNDNNITNLSFSWRPNEFSLTSRLDFNDNRGWSAGLLGQISIGSTSNRVFASNQTLVNQGSISAFVYHDRNNNGVFDGSDSPLPGVEVFSTPSIKQATTDGSGVAILPSLAAFKQTDIDINETTLPDPYMIQRNSGVSVRPSPGAIQKLEIPIVVSVEIEGTVRELKDANTSSPLAYVPIEVIDQFGITIKELLSEFDGYYLINNLPPGSYSIRVKQAYLIENGWLTPSPVTIDDTGRDVISGQDIILRKAFNQPGYSASLGEFSSIETLNSYWKVLNQKFPKLQNFEHFYAHSNGQYTLYAAFNKDRQSADRVCEIVNPANCSVKRIRRR